MKLIFSRKGFDSSYGRSPSPVLPSGQMVSFPIPEVGQRGYETIRATQKQTMRDLLEELGVYNERRHSGAHLDPDLRFDAVDRREGWRPCFGQSAQAQGHLRNQGVGKGDLFLFFGSFRHTIEHGGRLRFAPSAPTRHVLFGYLCVDKLIRIGIDPTPEWAAEHPHLTNPSRTSNTLYVAQDTLPWDSSIPGAGTFCYDPRLLLSKESSTTRIWSLPRYFHPDEALTTISRHDYSKFTHNGDTVALTTVSPGQEYVIDSTPDIAQWARSVVEIGLGRAASQH